MYTCISCIDPQNGFLSTLPYIGQFLMAFPVSAASAYLLERDIVSKVAARKIFNSMSYFGAASGLVWLAFVGCNSGQGVDSSGLGKNQINCLLIHSASLLRATEYN